MSDVPIPATYPDDKSAKNTLTLQNTNDYRFSREDAEELAQALMCAPLSKTITQHWTTESVPIILNIYSSLSLLQNLFRSHDRDGPLLWAAHLFTRTYVINIRNPTAMYSDSLTETQEELSKYMGKTLSSVSTALRAPGGAMRDDVLATVWILANYEVGSPSSPLPSHLFQSASKSNPELQLLIGSLDRDDGASHKSWSLHCMGVYSILKSRGPTPFATGAGRQAFWPAFNLIVSSRNNSHHASALNLT